MRRAALLGVFLLALAGLSWCVLPIPLPFSGDRGEYNTISGLIWCSDDWTCLHEIGHKMDHEGGWISQGDEFRKALKVYVVVEIQSRNPSALARFILDTPLSGGARYGYNLRAELYADIFATHAKGCPEQLPGSIALFYDKGRTQALITQYLPQMRLCGGFQ